MGCGSSGPAAEPKTTNGDVIKPNGHNAGSQAVNHDKPKAEESQKHKAKKPTSNGTSKKKASSSVTVSHTVKHVKIHKKGSSHSREKRGSPGSKISDWSKLSDDDDDDDDDEEEEEEEDEGEDDEDMDEEEDMEVEEGDDEEEEEENDDEDFDEDKAAFRLADDENDDEEEMKVKLTLHTEHAHPHPTEMPPPKPTTRKKIEIVPDVAMFAEVDKHADKAPSSCQTSVPALAKYLAEGMKTDLEKIRSIYWWVKSNISYNVKGFMSGHLGNNDSESVLQTRTSVCQGYSELFHDLCKNVGRTVKVLSGFAKGYGHDPEKHQSMSYTEATNHAWNAVYLDNEWRLIDCTWDAGHIDGKNYFKHDSEHYFLTDPEVFIFDHLPCLNKNDIPLNEKWQLLKIPVKIEKYAKRVRFEKRFFSYGLKSSEIESIIRCEEETEIYFDQLNSPMDGVAVHMVKMDDHHKSDHYVLVDLPRPKTIRFYIRPPFKGKYELKIYGKNNLLEKEVSNSNHSLVTYIILCEKVSEITEPFPEHFGWWGLCKPDQNKVQPQYHYNTTHGECIIQMDGDESMEILTSLKHGDATRTSEAVGTTFYEYRHGKFILRVRLKVIGFASLNVFMKNTETSAYQPYAYYLIGCWEPYERFKNFVQVYPFSKEVQAHLQKPYDKELPANSEVSLKFTASKSLTKVMVGSKAHDGDGSGSWDLVIHTGDPGTTINIFGQTDASGNSYNAMFGYISQ